MSVTLCGTNGANVGKIECAPSKGKALRMAIFAGSVAPAGYATSALTKAALIAASKLSKKAAGKLHLLPDFLDKESKRENNTEQTFTNGVKIVTREGLDAYQFSFTTNYKQLVSLRKFNNQEVRVIVQDENNLVWGAQKEVAGAINFVGAKARLFFDGMGFTADDKATGVCMVNITFLNVNESFDTGAALVPEVDLSSVIEPLIDTQLYEKLQSSTNVRKISLKVPTGLIGQDKDLYADFAPLWVVGNFTATVSHTGANLPITSVTPNVGGYADFTFDSAAYTALSSGTIILLNVVAPEVLDAANVIGIEVGTYSITK